MVCESVITENYQGERGELEMMVGEEIETCAVRYVLSFCKFLYVMSCMRWVAFMVSSLRYHAVTQFLHPPFPNAKVSGRL